MLQGHDAPQRTQQAGQNTKHETADHSNTWTGIGALQKGVVDLVKPTRDRLSTLGEAPHPQPGRPPGTATQALDALAKTGVGD